MSVLCEFVLCVGRGLAMSWSPAQGVLPTAYRIKKLKKKSVRGPTKGCRAIMMYRVGGTWPLLITKCTMLSHWWTPFVTLWHRSVSYILFISDSTSRYYNLSLQWVLTLWCLVSEWSLNLFCLECWQLTGWLTVINWLLAVEICSF
jgi:hypothetical protein